MGLVLPPIAAYHVRHLPIVKASADKIGLVDAIKQWVPTERAIDPGTMVLGMLLETLSGRSPLYRWEEFLTHQDTALLLGKAVPPEALQDETVGRVLERLAATGPMQGLTACAVRADQALHCDKRSGHCDTTSVRVYGDALPPEPPPKQAESQAQAVPLTMTDGYSKDKRPDLKQCVCSTLWVDRAGPLWGKPEDGHASETTVHNTLVSHIAAFLAKHGVAPGASLYVAEAALGTEEKRAALGDTLCITRVPATSNACGRRIAEAVAHNTWEAIGVLAHTKPPKQRPGTFYKAYEGQGTLSGTSSRAVVVPSSAQATRRQQRLARDLQASSSTMHRSVRTAEQREYGCRAEAAAAAAQRRAMHPAYPMVEVTGEERPVYGRGRPSPQPPRPITAMRYRLQATIRPPTARSGQREEAAGCFVLLTHGPPVGDLAHSVRDILTAAKDQHGTEHNYGLRTDPVIVHRLFLKKPARIEALGRLVLRALLLWRVMERAMRTYVDPTRMPVMGWDKQATERPTSCMMLTQCAGVIVFKRGPDRQLARPLSVVPQQALTALDVPAACFTRPPGEQRTAMVAQRLSRRHKPILQW